MKRDSLRPVLLVLGLILAVQAHAAEQDLTELTFEDLMDIPVFAASKKIQSLEEAPAFVTVVTREEIDLFGDRSLDTILDRLAGFYFTDDRAYTYLGSRGFGRPGDYNSRFLLLLNGVRVNDSVYDSFGGGSDFIVDCDLIQRIEIVRGPSSALYGTSAVFAVINVVTRTEAEVEGLETSVGAGSHEARWARAVIGHRWGSGTELVAGGLLLDEEGRTFHFPEYDAPETNNGRTLPGTDATHEGKAFLNLRQGNLALQAAYQHRRKHDPTGAWETVFNDDRTVVMDENLLASLQYTREYRSGWLLDGRVGLNTYRFDGDYLYDYAEEGQPADLAVNRDEARSVSWQGDFTLSTEKFRSQVWTLGMEARVNTRQYQTNYDVDYPETPYVRDDRTSNVVGVFGQDEIRLSEAVQLCLGLRFDRYPTFGGALSPRVALVTSPGARTTVKALFGSAFRAPNYYELYYADDTYFVPNPDLEPETFKSFELVVEQDIGQVVHATAAAYHYIAENLINQEEDPVEGTLQFKNLGEVKADGLDVVLSSRISGGVTGRLSWSHARVRDQATGASITNSPSNMVKLTLIAPVTRGGTAVGLSGRYTSSRLSFAGNEVPDQLVLDLVGKMRVSGTNLQIQGGVFNVMDADYGYPVGDEHRMDTIRADGRNVRVTLKYSW